jgi:hypothetical protein
VDTIFVAQDRFQWRAVVNTVVNLRFSTKDGKLLESWATISFSRGAGTLFHGVAVKCLQAY